MWSDDDPETRPGSDRQWWLTQGPEFCYLCEGSVHPEMLLYCIACDRGLCSLCLDENVQASGDVLCPECRAEQDVERR
jgi:hypothetical protein